MSAGNTDSSGATLSVWSFIKDIGPILVGLAAVVASYVSGCDDRLERTRETTSGRAIDAAKEARQNELDLSRRIVATFNQLSADASRIIFTEPASARQDAVETEMVAAGSTTLKALYAESELVLDPKLSRDVSKISENWSALLDGIEQSAQKLGDKASQAERDRARKDAQAQFDAFQQVCQTFVSDAHAALARA